MHVHTHVQKHEISRSICCNILTRIKYENSSSFISYHIEHWVSKKGAYVTNACFFFNFSLNLIAVLDWSGAGPEVLDWNGFERKAAGAPSRELVRELLSKLSHLKSTNGTIADPFCKFCKFQQVVKNCVKMRFKIPFPAPQFPAVRM